MAVQDWINQDYLNPKKQTALKKQFLANKPFPHLTLRNILKEDIAVALLNALSKQQFSEKESDLFKLMQTPDFISTDNKLLRAFREFLASKEFIDFMHSITGIKMKSGVVDCNGSLYQNTDFLLPHDDQLEGRAIAFIFYFSTLTKKDGGPLALFSSKNKKPLKVVKTLYPEFNSMNFFQVLPISFHEVHEITSDVQRISINGWFHG